MLQYCKSCKRVVTLEMSCSWVNNRKRKDEELDQFKYRPLRWELRQQFPGYKVKQYNMPLGGVVTGAGCHDEKARARQKHRRTAKDADGSALGHVEHRPDLQGCSLNKK